MTTAGLELHEIPAATPVASAPAISPAIPTASPTRTARTRRARPRAMCLAGSPWRQYVIARLDELESFATIARTRAVAAAADDVERAAVTELADATARLLADGRAAAHAPGRGAGRVQRAYGSLNAAEVGILRYAPLALVAGWLPEIAARVGRQLDVGDPRRLAVEAITARPPAAPLDEHDRELLVWALRGAGSASDRRHLRLRSFRLVLLGTAALLTAAALGLGLLAWHRPDVLSVCFEPPGSVVCPTGTRPAAEGAQGAASGWDVLAVELVGLVAAALAAARSLRDARGSATPYGVAVALAMVKLPSGAITAVVGLLLMRGEFVPGLSALDTPGQIVAWAVVFGYAQQAFTGAVDRQAADVADRAGGVAPALAPVPGPRDPVTP